MSDIDDLAIDEAIKTHKVNTIKLAGAVRDRGDDELSAIFNAFLDSLVELNAYFISKGATSDAIHKAKGGKP